MKLRSPRFWKFWGTLLSPPSLFFSSAPFACLIQEDEDISPFQVKDITNTLVFDPSRESIRNWRAATTGLVILVACRREMRAERLFCKGDAAVDE